MEREENYSGFVRMSKYAGMREDLVQAGGGNSSYKLSQTEMAIKASGYQLSDLTESEGYVIVNPAIIRDAFLRVTSLDDLTEEYSNQILKDAFMKGKRPSIETFLHSISGTYTLHTHPIVVNAITCRKDGMNILADLFPNALLVPYAKPGVELAKAYFKEYKKKATEENQIFDIVFMQNHGLVVSGRTADEVIEKTEDVVSKIEDYLKADFSAYKNITKLWKLFPDKIVWRVTDANILDIYTKNGMWDHQFCPDCVVFLGKKALKLKNLTCSDDINTFKQENGEPVIIESDNNLFIVADSVKKAMETQSVMSFSAQVMDLNKGYECNLLSEYQQDELLNWDAEKYRKNMK